MNVGYAAKNLVRAAAIVAVASAAGACSSVPDWMNPFGDDTPSVTDEGAMPEQQQVAEQPTAAPDLADVPGRPMAGTLPDSQRQVAESLSADRSRAKYSGDALRGDAATAAPPPAAPSAAELAASTAPSDEQVADNSSSSSGGSLGEQPTTDTGDTAAPPPPAPAPVVASADTSSSAVAPPSVAPTGMPAVPPGPAPVRSAAPAVAASSYTPPPMPSGGSPAVPAVAARGGVRTASAVPGAQPAVMSDAQLGFQQSTAPALDPSVSQFVSPAILNRYSQTSRSSRAYTGGGGAAVPATAVASNTKRSRYTGVGGPDEMSGSVVANLDSLSGTAGASAPYTSASGVPATAVVFFPGDTTILNASAKAQVRAAAQNFRANGGAGFIRVVGHASSRTGNMPLERHLVVIFEKSQQRANSVAQELIRAGVPADRVLVEAVGDSQPVYYESMPKGEDGNRRAEIFLQS